MEKTYKHNHVGVKYVGMAEIVVYKEYFNEWKEDCYFAKVTTLSGETVTKTFKTPSSTAAKRGKAFNNFCKKRIGNKKEYKFKEKIQIDSWNGLSIPSIGMIDTHTSFTKKELKDWR